MVAFYRKRRTHHLGDRPAILRVEQETPEAVLVQSFGCMLEEIEILSSEKAVVPDEAEMDDPAQNPTAPGNHVERKRDDRQPDRDRH